MSFDKKGQVFKDWKAMFPAVALSGIVAVIIKIIFTRYKLVIYDYAQMSGRTFFDIPVEAAFYCFTLAFCRYLYL